MNHWLQAKFLCAILLLPLCLSGCSHFMVNSRAQDATYQNSTPLPPFTAITVTGPFKVRLVQAEQASFYRVVASGSPASLQLLNLKVTNQTLYISNKTSLGTAGIQPKWLEITLPLLRQIKCAEGCEITGQSLRSDNLAITATGNGQIDLQGVLPITELNSHGTSRIKALWLDSDKLKIRANNASQIFLAGIVDNLDAVVTGQAKLNAKYLRSKKAYVHTTQSALAEIWANDFMNTLATDNSNIYYYRNAKFMAPYMRNDGAIMSMEQIGSY